MRATTVLCKEGVEGGVVQNRIVNEVRDRHSRCHQRAFGMVERKGCNVTVRQVGGGGGMRMEGGGEERQNTVRV